MLGKPEHGWTQIQIGDFTDRASYLTDVPMQCLKAFTHALENNLPATINFDAEGWEYIVISDCSETHIITNDDEAENTYTVYCGIGKKDLAKELIEDIEEHFENWVGWIDNITNETEKRKRDLELNILLARLRKLI